MGVACAAVSEAPSGTSVDSVRQLVYNVGVEGLERVVEKRYLTSEAAEMCDRDGSHMRRLCKRHGLGTVEYKGGRKRWLTQQELDALLRIVREQGNEKRRLGRSVRLKKLRLGR